MALTTYFERIARIDQLIRLKATGSPRALAERLEISESGIYRYIGYMRNLGAPIVFCKSRNSYIYEDMGRFQMGFVVKPMNDYELTDTFGGMEKKLTFFFMLSEYRSGRI